MSVCVCMCLCEHVYTCSLESKIESWLGFSKGEAELEGAKETEYWQKKDLSNFRRAHTLGVDRFSDDRLSCSRV